MRKQHHTGRKLLVKNQFRKLKKRLETSIQTGRFYQFTKHKQREIVGRLDRYARRLEMSLRLKIGGATLVLGLVASSPSHSQSFTEIKDTNSPFIIYHSPFFGEEGYNSPAFVDMDGDGDDDVFFGQRQYYKNVGGGATPEYELQAGAANPLAAFSSVGSFDLSFTDLDNDNDFDAVYVDNDTIRYLKNEGNALNPNFSLAAVSPFDVYNAGPTVQRFSPEFADVDGDGDQDLFLGGTDSVTYIMNTGDASNPSFEASLMSPAPAINLSSGETVLASFADIDDDGDLDCIVGLYNEIRYFRNVGNVMNPSFQEQIGPANPFRGLWLGSDVPRFNDFDGDGDLDGFASPSSVRQLTNIGTATNPQFVMSTHSALYFARPTAADMDDDGDLDIVVGESYYGVLRYFKNNGTPTSPNLAEQVGPANPFEGLTTVDYLITPDLADLDNDGDNDLIFGEYYGTVKYFKNTGTAVNPSFTAQTGMNNPLGGVNTGTVSSPTFVDIDMDGDFDVFAGEGYGSISYYKNVGDNMNPVFAQQTGTDNPLDISVGGDYSTAPAFSDIDNDGDLDVVMGGYYGTIYYFKNTGDAFNPVFVQQTGGNNPFDAVNLLYASRPTFADLDGDGDEDLIIGSGYGELHYLRNNAVVSSNFNTNTATFSLELHPNPVHNTLYVKLASKTRGEVNYSIFDVLGRQVQQGRLENASISVKELPEAAYLLRIELENGEMATRPFIRQ